MIFLGRTRELGRLRAAFDRRDASILRVTGMRGVGKSALLRRACADFSSLVFRCAPASDQAQRAALQAALGTPIAGVHDSSELKSWAALLQDAAEMAEPGGRGFVLVVDDAYRLAHGRSRLESPLAAVVDRARAEQRALHVVLVSHDRASLSFPKLGAFTGGDLHVEPLPFRSAIGLLPGSKPRDFIRSYAVFGGVPRTLGLLDPALTLSTNIRNIMLEPEADLSAVGADWLERDVQNPTRYYAVLSALSHGQADWAAVHAGVPDLTASGQVAPYVQRLEDLGVVRVSRSLDAAPRSRSRRYQVTDPFLAFWFRFGLPNLFVSGRDPSAHFKEAIRPLQDAHTASIFPEVCRQYMEHDASEQLSSNARESGSLWGADHQIDVAGILASGAAYYGSCHWTAIPESANPLADLDSSIRETRYGFGREARLRILFSARDLPRSVEREVARRADASMVGAEALTGLDAGRP
jgi:uncharacterized protein